MARSLINVRRHVAGHLEALALRGSGRRGATLANFLQSDVQGDLEAARALLAELGMAERERVALPTAVGNAYAISAAADGVTLRNAVLDNARPEHFTFDEMRHALGLWIAAIERARREPG